MADVAADEEVDRARGAQAHPLDLRVRRHRRPRGDAAAARHGRRSRPTRPSRRRSSARSTAASRAFPAYEDTHRQHRRARVPEGPRAPRPRRRGRASRCATRCAPAVFVPEQKRVAELLREMQHEAVPHGDRRSTSTAAPPGSSRWRTCSRRSWARSPTSTTSTSPASSTCPTARCGCPGSTPIDERERGARRRAARHRVGHGRRPRVQPARPRARARARPCGSRGSSSAPSGCRGGASCRC